MIYDSDTKQVRNSFEYSWEFGRIRPESPRYCAEFTTMCNNIFGITEISLRINQELDKNTPNAARIAHELTEITDNSRDFFS